MEVLIILAKTKGYFQVENFLYIQIEKKHFLEIFIFF